MPIPFYIDIDLNSNELINASIHNALSDPLLPAQGQIYFNTNSKELKYFNGTSWIVLANANGLGGVLQFTNRSEFPATGKTELLYISKDNRDGWYWDGTSYIKIGSFSSDFQISLSGGKPFLKWTSGQIVPALNKTAREILLEGSVEAIAPTVSISVASAQPNFNQTSVTNVINYSSSVNSLGASFSSVVLEYSFNGGAFTNLGVPQPSGSSLASSYTSAPIVIPAFFTGTFRYRLTVTDTAGGTATSNIVTISPRAYVAPTITNSVSPTALNNGQTNLIRERGNKSSSLTSTINTNSSLVPLSNAVFERSLDGGAWVQIGSPEALTGNNGTIPVFTHDDSLLVNANTIAYRVRVVDTFTTSYSSVVTITFRIFSYLGYATTSTLTSSQIRSLENGQLLASRTRTISPVSAGPGLFTYIVYQSSFGAITGIIQDGATPVLGGFTQIETAFPFINQYGVNTPCYIYKSNNTNAFTNSTLAIS